MKQMVTRRKIALFGGTFDPVHLGHIIVSAAAAEHIGAEKIIFIPAKRSPLKRLQPQASDTDRFNMISLAIAGENIFEVSNYELVKTSPSFTLDTIRYFHTKYSGNTLMYWLIGADSIDELPHWYHIEELIDECHLCVMYRAGCKQPDFASFEPLWGRRRVEKLQNNITPTPLVDISSTEVRNRLGKNLDVAQMLHPEVLRYIQKHQLYQSKPGPNRN
jgi:nicotinate-nucleotide adenylyltransferase